MQETTYLTLNQAAALRALKDADIETSLPEVAVDAQLLPSEAKEALTQLTAEGLASVHPAKTGEPVYVLTRDGRTIAGALHRGSFPVGSVKLARPAFLRRLLYGSDASAVHILPNEAK
jgi:hypothetical protein